MPHLRNRHLKENINKSLKFSPLVGVLGHRQVGKTTLCTLLGQDYLSFDQYEFLQQGLHSPLTLLNAYQKAPVVLDECQLAPPLFPALKEWIRTHPKPGQFLLSGSVRFLSRKAIRESLTGRIINWELLPMDLSETHSAPLPGAIPKLVNSKNFDCPLKPASYFSDHSYQQAMMQGGLPGIFAVRDAIVRRQRFETQIETLLERDLRLLVQTTLDFRTLRNLLALLASQQGLPLELASLARSSRISVPALRRIVQALESMFVIRMIETEGSRKRPVLFFEDQGEATHLTGERPDHLSKMTQFLFSYVRQQWVYRPELEAQMFQYRNRGGAFVPLAIHSVFHEPPAKSRLTSTSPRTLGLIPMLDETPSKHDMASAQSFLEAYKEKNPRCVFIHTGKSDRLLGRQMRVVPLSHLV